MATPYHYTPLVQELSEAMRHILQASDWREGLGIAATANEQERRLQEHGNMDAAVSRLRSAFRVADERKRELETDVRLAEQSYMKEATKLRDAIQRDELPDPLREAHPEVTAEGE